MDAQDRPPDGRLGADGAPEGEIGELVARIEMIPLVEPSPRWLAQSKRRLLRRYDELRPRHAAVPEP